MSQNDKGGTSKQPSGKNPYPLKPDGKARINKSADKHEHLENKELDN